MDYCHQYNLKNFCMIPVCVCSHFIFWGILSDYFSGTYHDLCPFSCSETYFTGVITASSLPFINDINSLSSLKLHYPRKIRLLWYYLSPEEAELLLLLPAWTTANLISGVLPAGGVYLWHDRFKSPLPGFNRLKYLSSRAEIWFPTESVI